MIAVLAMGTHAHGTHHMPAAAAVALTLAAWSWLGFLLYGLYLSASKDGR